MQDEVSVLLAAQILQMAQIRSDLLRHGTEQADMEWTCHEIVNLAQP